MKVDYGLKDNIMAASPSHKLGQLIGNLLEDLFIPLLKTLSQKSNIYLDIVGHSREARKGKKITWNDSYGSSHDLDFVFEYDGSETKLGRPIAFIESAWRRYTKHSKNKAQEIQGAILPIADKYWIECPFKGAILAGEFTEPSLKQLEKCGFEVLYIHYKDFVAAFNTVGIDISFDEDTPESVLKTKVHCVENLDKQTLNKVKNLILIKNNDKILEFTKKLEQKIQKTLEYIIISPLYGHDIKFNHIEEAKNFIRFYEKDSTPSNLQFKKFIIKIKYINNDNIEAAFSNTATALNFLDKILH